jgi:hypothetical protein
MDRDSASANVAMKSSDMGCLTEEQKQARDKHIESMHRALFSNYLIEEQEQEMQLMTTGVSTVDNGEMDNEEMPDLVYDTSEETLESEWFKLKFLTETIIRVRQVES